MKIEQSIKETIQSGVSDLVCFCHLRWDFVYQRPQHIMSRMAKTFRVFFIEEPLFHDGADDISISLSGENVWIVTPVLQHGHEDQNSVHSRQRKLLDRLFVKRNIENFIAWYYTPMALKFTNHLKPRLTIYDCMDELSAFKFAPAELKLLETELFGCAGLVFTGGHSLYQAKKNSHHNIYPFPSSIDKDHFAVGRVNDQDPIDQKDISGFRLGFYGVIDERFNIGLIEEVARLRPDWQLILLGPVVKINDEDLPRRENIHYLGSKTYKELPMYLSGWDMAIIPFEKNESTKYISPTKTPEYLAAGKPVISSSIMDVVTPYADKGLVYIADNAQEFIAAAENEINKDARAYQEWLSEVDKFLIDVSWDNTTRNMMERIQLAISELSEKKEGFRSVA